MFWINVYKKPPILQFNRKITYKRKMWKIREKWYNIYSILKILYKLKGNGGV